MRRRNWDSRLKAEIVLEGLRGRPLGELCNKYEISQSQYYKWRDQFLSNASVAFETSDSDRRTERLKAENNKLKGLIGELTVELKKSDW